MALRAGYRRHRCLGTAREARWAKPCTRRARLFAGERSIAAEHAGRAGKRVVQIVRPEWQDVHCLAEQGWVFLPVAGLVEGGGFAGTGRDVAVVDVVGGVRLAACGSRLASGVASVTRLSPDLAPGRGHPVARWRGQHVGCGAAGAEVEIHSLPHDTTVSIPALEESSRKGKHTEPASLEYTLVLVSVAVPAM